MYDLNLTKMKNLMAIKKVLFSMLVALSMIFVLPSCGGGAEQGSDAEQTEEPAAEEKEEGGN